MIGTTCMAMLPLPVIAPDVYLSLANSLETLDPASALPPGTNKAIIAGYTAQLKLMAAGIRSNNTAWLQTGIGGSPSIAIFNMHPLSRGYVNINTSAPLNEPVVDYRVLTNPVDIQIHIALLKGMRKYFASDALRGLEPVEISPGANVTTDEDLAVWVENVLGPSAYHPVGTCAKMPVELGGVVDESLKVHGVSRLRVVDASIMPLLVGAATQSTVYSIAEKVSCINASSLLISKRQHGRY